jgi:hypothetical protein
MDKIITWRIYAVVVVAALEAVVMAVTAVFRNRIDFLQGHSVFSFLSSPNVLKILSIKIQQGSR